MTITMETLESVEGEMPVTDLVPGDGGLGGRIRNSMSLVQERVTAVEQRARAQWVGIPDHLRDALEQIAQRLRSALDLPSRGELQELIARVEQLDTQISVLQASQGGRATKSKNKTAPPAKKTAAKKTAAKKTAAKKTAAKKASAKKAAAKKAPAKKPDRKAKIKKAAAKSSRK